MTLVLFALFLGTLAIVLYAPEEESAPRPSVVKRPTREARTRPVRPATEPGGERAVMTVETEADVPADDELEPLAIADVRRAAESTLAVLELQGENGRSLRDTYALVVRADGALITRLRPLLGATSGSCRLPGFRQIRAPVLGISRYDEALDLAVVRFEPQPGFSAEMPVLEQAPGDILAPNESLWTFVDHQPTAARVARPRVFLDGLDLVELAATPAVSAESFFAADAYGFLVGLCFTEDLRANGAGANDKLVGAGLPVGATVYVTPVSSLVPWLDAPASLSLRQLTERLWTGSFANLMEIGDRARAANNLALAIDSYARAVAREGVEPIAPDALARAWERLRECYLAEIGRLVTSQLHSEVVTTCERAVELFPRETVFWSVLADAHASLGDFSGAVRALLEIRALSPDGDLNARLERIYLAWGGQEMGRGDERRAESVYLEGIEHLPRSGRLCFELGSLYFAWEAWDAAARYLAAARDLDRSLASQATSMLDRIDDILSNRDAVILPIDGGPIRSSVVVDGRTALDFVIDTGATHTTIPRSFAARLGYDLSRGERVIVRTAGGQVTASKIILGLVDLGGYQVRNLEALVLPDSVSLEFGLLGLNFLENFRYQVDATRGEFRLERP
ncbi:MAG TPA: retropepsin-like aspartic protease [Planctomycetota bacterium]|nr:retropepsin-like aspartic protease [Planctomycetota bacterium]